jgi:hypothetical protein
MNEQLEECDGRILLGDNRVGGAAMLRSIRFQCFLIWDFKLTAIFHVQCVVDLRHYFRNVAKALRL